MIARESMVRVSGQDMEPVLLLRSSVDQDKAPELLSLLLQLSPLLGWSLSVQVPVWMPQSAEAESSISRKLKHFACLSALSEIVMVTVTVAIT